MMKSAEDRPSNELAEPLDRPTIRRILVQGQVCSAFVVIAGVGRKDAAQMALAEDDGMIEALPADRADYQRSALHRQHVTRGDIRQIANANAEARRTLVSERWARANLFSSWPSTAISLLLAYLLARGLFGFVDWAIVNAVWSVPNGDTEICRALAGSGACWAVVGAKYRFIRWKRRSGSIRLSGSAATTKSSSPRRSWPISLSGKPLSTVPGSPLLDNVSGAAPRRTVMSEYHAAGAATGAFMVRKGKFKYVYYVGMPAQLFDLQADPYERRNLAPDAGYRRLAADCEVALRKVVDPEAADALARKDQAAKINEFGGREKILAMGSFEHSPVPGTKAVYN